MSQEFLALDRNENFFPHSAELLETLSRNHFSASTYAPKNAQNELQEHLARYLSIDSKFITLGHGGEDILIKILTWLRRSSNTLVRLDFSWQTYAHIANGLDYSLLEVPCEIENGSYRTSILSLERALLSVPNTAVVVLTTPNNPTGHTLHHTQISELAQKFSRHIFIVDAVYDSPMNDHISNALNFPNVIIIGSFSKFFGMPGIRVGYAICQTLPAAFQLVLGFPPNILEACKVALKNSDEYLKNRQEMLRFASQLFSTPFSGLRVFKSEAPFVLVEIECTKITEAVIAKSISDTAIQPKVFSMGQKRFLRWGLGPSAVNNRILNFMNLLAKSSQ